MILKFDVILKQKNACYSSILWHLLGMQNIMINQITWSVDDVREK